ncbi:MAG: zeta toxin family protein [Clostridia bacterium]|nr:zeta toxin family protein [Clostridia bacterium]
MNYNQEFLNYCDGTIWKDNVSNEILEELSQKAFLDMKEGKTKSKKLFRICGQSGSGKTTQILYAVNEVLNDTNIKPVVIAVRNFATYHPDYQNLINKYGKGEIREKTNGFALKLLCLTLCKFVENGYFIVMDITLLSKEFEKIVLELLKQNEYMVEYLIMSVPKEQSDYFIQKRMEASSGESNRVVYKSSSEFFYFVLAEGLRFLVENDPFSMATIWSAYKKEPVFYGKLKRCYQSFEENREILNDLIYTEEELRQSKLEFLTKTSKLIK